MAKVISLHQQQPVIHAEMSPEELSPVDKAFNRGIAAAADFVADQGEDALAGEIRNLAK